MFRRGGSGVYLMILVALVAATSLGCATHGSRTPSQTYNLRGDRGFLTRATKDENLFCYVNPNAKFSMYDSLLLDPVSVSVASGTDAERSAARREKQLRKLVDVFRSELRYDYNLAQQPGPGVMRLRLALLSGVQKSPADEENSAPETDETSRVPVFSVESSRNGPLILGELTDAMNGETLMAVLVQQNPDALFWGTGTSGRRSEDTYRFWASRLRQRLEEFRRRSRSVSASQGDRWTALEESPSPNSG